MKVINFGEILRRIRGREGITQSELVDLIDLKSSGDCGIDTVTISRWENNVVSPCHKRQIDIVYSLGYELHNLIDKGAILIDEATLNRQLLKKLLDSCYWDFSNSNYHIEDLHISAVEDKGTSHYLIVERGSKAPVAYLMYHKELGTLSQNEGYLVIDALYCTNRVLLLELIHILIHKVLIKEVYALVVRSKSKTTPMYKFAKSIGFKVLGRKEESYVSVLSYEEVLYKPHYFYLASCYSRRFLEYKQEVVKGLAVM